jgi:hypothetical protein
MAINSSGPKVSTFIRIFLVPTLVIKSGIMFFGLNYSMYPGEGYGYGLAICLALTIINFGIFLWTFRNYSDD